MTKPNIIIPNSFAANGDKTDFDESHITNGFPTLTPDVLRGDNLNKFIDDTYKGLNGVLELYEGCVLYDSGTTYNNKSIVFYINTDNEVEVYRSLINNNLNNPLTDDTAWEKVELGGGSGYEVGDIIIRNTPTNDAGKHLLDGALIQYGSYQAFVDYIADLYNTSTDKYSNVTKIGSVVDTDGVLSGFSASNYATLPQTFNPSSSNWEVVVPITTLSSFVECDFFASTVSGDFGIHAQLVSDGKIHLYLSSNGTSHNIASNVVGASTLSVNTKYWIKIAFNGTSYNVYSSTTGEFNGEEITQITVNSSAVLCTMTTTVLGRNPNPSYQNPFNGSIDLNGCYINIDGQRWWSGRQTSGFVTENEWQATVTTYGSCGKYVYDSVNNTVRLPKITGFIEGTTDLTALGDLVEAGLPNITGGVRNVAFDGYATSNVYGAFNSVTNVSNATGGSSSNERHCNFTFSASASNSIYGNSSTVQPQAIKVLYYIVIATSTKTDIQVDIDEIATDLNGKADVDLTNVNDLGTSRGAGWAMPSDTYVDLTLGASGSTYTAPANGWFMGSATGNGVWVQLKNATSDFSVTNHTPNNGVQLDIILPVSKGDIVAFGYTAQAGLRFYYAVGSESEAN